MPRRRRSPGGSGGRTGRAVGGGDARRRGWSTSPQLPHHARPVRGARPGRRAARRLPAKALGALDAVLANTPPETRDPRAPWLLAPIDLQAIKAAGVTFAVSMLERVIEERARGDLTAAAAIRAEVTRLVGDDLGKLKPGSPEAMRAEAGADRSRAPGASIWRSASARTPRSSPRRSRWPRSAPGWTPASIRTRPGTIRSPRWCWRSSSAGRIVGATLGNDVNLRDVEGRSALLLGKAKDNNASCAIGPFLRLFDAGFSAGRHPPRPR